jgi:gliding motility-associated-like protein
MTRAEKYSIFIAIALIFPFSTFAQYQFKIWSGNLGAAIYKQDFGTGTDDVTIPGSPLSAGVTSFPFVNTVCPEAGNYSIVQKVNVNNCSNGKWLTISLDHRQEKNGNMMLVHNLANSAERIVYLDTVRQDLCANIIYEFSAAIVNVDARVDCPEGMDYPRFRFSLEDAGGNELKSYTTDGISAAPAGTSAGPMWKFSIYGFDYTLPISMNKVVLKITLLRSDHYGNCNNDFAIDDILFSPAGPTDKIFFDAFPDNSVTAVCFQDNKVVAMTGDVDPFYANPAYQWEQSTNNGFSWTIIPGATSTSYAPAFSVADTFLIRMRASEDFNIDHPACGVVSNILRIEVDGQPPVGNVSSNSPVCVGANLQFNAEGGVSYVWTGPNGFYDNVYYAHIYHSVLADSGTYYVQIKSYGGCVVTASTHVSILGTADVTAGAPQSVCKGSMVQLTATGGSTYLWRPSAGLTDATIANPKATPQATTTYTVEATNEFGCVDSASVKISLLNSIEVKANISGPIYICRPSDSATFKDASWGAITTWNWDFGNGMKSPEQNPAVQQYFIDNNATTYTVQLVVADSAGCADTTSHVMQVENNCYIAVPNAFTPNGDGLNDYLYPLNAYKATDLLFRVFNRQGQVVFETRDWTQKWDGRFKGNPLTTDVFVWQLSYTDATGKKIFLKGSTLLIR